MVDLSSSFLVNVYQRVAVFWLLIQYYTILYQYYTNVFYIVMIYHMTYIYIP